ncbi:MAG: AAA-like domain-containing protein [Fimbriimonadaceae bacterium]|nr:AAA-like domain-containing protein [Fimbriimonadaceae bacterium]
MRGSRQSEVGWVLVEAQATFFVAGGTLGCDAPSYLPRSADAQLRDALIQSRYAYVLDSRQKGKSSLVARTMAKLQESGIRCVKIDLQRIGANLSPDQWYAALVRQFGRQLGKEKEVFQCWGELQDLGPLSRWVAVLEQVVLPSTEGPVVVFIDEVDFVRALSFSADEFFAAIRECHNRRAIDPLFVRLTFCLVGSATPSQLVRNVEVTPFNIGQEVALTDFTLAEILPYAAHLGTRDGQSLIERVYYWTSGHPFLTQSLCAAIVQAPDCLEAKDVDAIVAEMFLSTEARQRQPNLLDISRRILEARIPGVGPEEARGQMLNAYRQILAGKRLIVDDSEWRLAALRLSGAVKDEGGTIVSRNRIYATVFDRSWIRANMPEAEVRRQRAAAIKAMIKTGTVALLVTAIVGYLAYRSSRLADQQAQLKRQAQYDAYCAAMIAASTKWDDADRSGLKAVLDAHEQDPWRGWEWGFWNNRIGGKILEFPGVQEPAIQFGAGGQLLVRTNGALTRYDSQTLRPLRRYEFEEGSYWMTRELPDQRILDAQRDGRLRCFDPELKYVLWEANIGSVGWPNGNLFDSQFRWMVNENDRTLRLTDLATGKSRNPPGLFFRPDFSKDTNSVLCTFRIADRTFPIRPTSAVILDPASLNELHHLPVRAGALIVAASYERRLLSVGYSDGEVQLYDLRSQKRLLTHRFRASEVWHLSFNRSGTRLYSCTMDKQGAVFDVANAQPSLMREFTGFWGLSFSPDGQHLIGRFHPPVLLDQGELETSNSPLNVGPFDAPYFPRRANFMVVPLKKNGLIQWSKVQLDGTQPHLTGGAFTSSREVIAESGLGTARIRKVDGTDEILDVLTGKTIGRNFDAKLQWRTYVQFENSGGMAITDFHGSNAYYVSNSGVLELLIRTYSLPLDFSPDRKTLAVGTDLGTLYLINTITLEMTKLQLSRFTLNDGEFSRDGKRIAIAHDPNTAGIFDVSTGKPIVRFVGHSSNVLGISWSPDGRRIATGGRDQTVRVWDAKTGRMLSILRGHRAPVRYVRFLPNGVHLVSVDMDGNLIRWTGLKD